MPLHIDHVPPADLLPASYNPRTITDAAFERLKRGISHFGLVDPIIARREDGLVVGGHQRLRAAMDLEMETVPVIYLEDIDDTQAASLNILLNNPGAQGEWDIERLSALLNTLSEHNTTLLGFGDDELMHLLAVTNSPPPVTTSEDSEAGLTSRGYRENGDAVTVTVFNAAAVLDVRTALAAVLSEHPEWDAHVAP